ncbi:hypothetical protein CPB86DRAFT_800281 [Serendipita vermifera]|nr:hypothetical protein CPB86DRAFT_800281 [Serendipita vermifera]
MLANSVVKSVIVTVGLSGLVSADRGIDLWRRQDADPCATIANQTYVVPSKVIACFNYFNFNSTLRDNIVDVVSKSLNFHASTNYQLSSTVFPDVQVDIQAELQRIKESPYSSDYEVHKDVSAQVKRLFDGHCTYINYCYDSLYISYLPFPLVNLDPGSQQTNQTVYIAPEAFEVTSKEFAPFLDQWQSLAGFNFTKYSAAQVIAIDGSDPWVSVEENAKIIGSWQGRSQRENSFFSSYIRGGAGWTYRMGDFAARSLPPANDSVSLTVIPADSTEPETINVPFISRITVPPFADSQDFWRQNCVATAETNGADYYQSGVMAMQAGTVMRVDPSPPKFAEPIAPEDRKHLLSSFVDTTAFTNIDLPPRISPSIPVASNGTASFHIQGKVGILALGSFTTGAGYAAWFTILDAGLKALKANGTTHLIVDVSNNGGGFICVANYLHRYLAGPSEKTEPQAGFDTKARYNILASNITQTIINSNFPSRGDLLYDPINWSYGDSSAVFPEDYNWVEPPVKTVVNGRNDTFTQKLGDECLPFLGAVPDEPWFPIENIGIITMQKKEGAKVAVVGGRQSVPQQYTGTVGGQSTSFAAIDSEIKTTHLKNHPLAPPDFIGSSYQGITWRLGFGIDNPLEPEEWQNHEADFNLPLTLET